MTHPSILLSITLLAVLVMWDGLALQDAWKDPYVRRSDWVKALIVLTAMKLVFAGLIVWAWLNVA